MTKAFLLKKMLALECVVPNVGDITDFAMHIYNSSVVENMDINEYVSCCDELLSNNEKYKTFSKNSLLTIKENVELFSLKSISKIWVDILTD